MPKHAILIVDDEEAVLESLGHLFHRTYRVRTADSGEKALEILRAEDVDVILSDQRMPGMSGDQFLVQARNLRPEAIRLLFTGYADLQAVIRAINEGQIYRYIVKPWEPQELESIVRQAVAQRELIADRTRLMQDLREANERLQTANARLVEREAMKTAFLEVASHEFNTPIQLILGFAEVLKLSGADRDPEEQEILGHVVHSANQLAKLLRSTLSMMAAQDFRNPPRSEPTPIEALLTDALEQVRPFLRARSQQVALEVDPDLGVIEADPQKLRDALVQLLTNAIKFTPDGGRLSIEAAAVGDDRVEVRIRDEGVGMEPAEIALMFEPFFAGIDPSRHSSGDFGFGKRGLGLGLSLVKRVVEMHHGTIDVRSSPGQGTTFRLTFPRRPDIRTFVPAPETWQL